MNRTLASIVLAVLAATLWLLWNLEHEHTSIRAPWTGVTYAASGLGFLAAGVVGRGWRSLVVAIAAAAAAVMLVDRLVWRSEPSASGVQESCDPGCLSLQAIVVIACTAAAVLAAVGILLRRIVGPGRRYRAPDTV